MFRLFEPGRIYGYTKGPKGRRVHTSDQESEVYHSIEQVVKEVGKPIPLVEAVKIVATRDQKVRDFYDVDNELSEDDEGLWELIYQILDHS